MRTLAALSLAALAAGCKLTNDTVLVAMLVQSPPAPAGFGATVTQTTAAQVLLAQTSVTSPSAGDLKPISGATVKLIRTPLGMGSTEIATLAETQPGFYEATGDFYQATATFRFVAQVGSDQYWGEVQNAPSAPAMTLTGATPTGDVYTYPTYSGMPSPFPVQRTCPQNALCDVAIYGVWPVTGATVSATPSCTNAPADVAQVLQLAYLNDLPWRAPQFDLVKATCFPQPGSYPAGYLVGLAALKRGTTSGNTSVASAVVAGTSDSAGVMVAAQ